MSGCRARIANSRNAFHVYVCGRGVKDTVQGFGLCGIHANKLDRSGYVLVCPLGPKSNLVRLEKSDTRERTTDE